MNCHPFMGGQPDIVFGVRAGLSSAHRSTSPESVRLERASMDLETAAGTSRARVALWGLCLAGLLLRLLLVWQCANAPLVADMQEYYDRARFIVEHHALFNDASRGPIFPLLLAPLLKAFGTHAVLAIRIANALIGSLCIALTAALGDQLVGRRWALVGAAIVAFYPTWILYTVFVLSEIPFTLFVLLAFWLWTRQRRWAAPATGVIVALSAQTRTPGVAIFAGMLSAGLLELYSAPRDELARRLQVRRLLGFVSAFALAMAPWTLRNALEFHAFIPVDASAGANVFIGNNPIASGRWSNASATFVAAHSNGDPLSAGLAFIWSHPWQATGLAVKKVGILLGLEGHEETFVQSFNYFGARTSGMIWLWGVAILAAFPLVVMAAVAGLCEPWLFSSRLKSSILFTSMFVVVAHVITFAESRYHLPWVPLLGILAAAGVAPGTPPWSVGRRAICAAVIFILCVHWISQLPESIGRINDVVNRVRLDY
jgi:4-amino-4-deoxy-L-arabinose transferase-like glycosyltransferase